MPAALCDAEVRVVAEGVEDATGEAAEGCGGHRGGEEWGWFAGELKCCVGKVFALFSTLFVLVTLYVMARTLRRWRQDDTKGRGGTRKKGKGKKTTSTGLTAAEKKALGRKSRKALVGIIVGLWDLGVGGGVMSWRNAKKVLNDSYPPPL